MGERADSTHTEGLPKSAKSLKRLCGFHQQMTEALAHVLQVLKFMDLEKIWK